MLRLVVYILFSVTIFAKDLDTPIQSLIDKIKRADPENRRELINKLKIEIKKVNIEKRKRSIAELKRAFKNKNNSKYNKNHLRRQRRDFRRLKFRSHR
jgi:hypothetical protein